MASSLASTSTKKVRSKSGYHTIGVSPAHPSGGRTLLPPSDHSATSHLSLSGRVMDSNRQNS
ncbi:hypothetical protein T02_318 [Trichinella nativa]|uniref:Uncharacterized protein n=1 Tax=Trichinella nativa TaxID=6335 RepID=A0A0V1KRN2_9BILA|nr:hypothetical protein T02_318 [Trichinella nativa]